MRYTKDSTEAGTAALLELQRGEIEPWEAVLDHRSNHLPLSGLLGRIPGWSSERADRFLRQRNLFSALRLCDLREVERVMLASALHRFKEE
jgi:hypothetical protein